MLTSPSVSRSCSGDREVRAFLKRQHGLGKLHCHAPGGKVTDFEIVQVGPIRTFITFFSSLIEGEWDGVYAHHMHSRS